MQNGNYLSTYPAIVEDEKTIWRSIKEYSTGFFSIIILLVNTFTLFPLFLLVAFLKLISPLDFFKKLFTRILNGISELWLEINNWNFNLKGINLKINGLDGLDPEGWYLVLSNHQSWTDIIVLQRVFNRKIPILKFFLKKELIWVPILGFCWWALDFPFMKRYSKELLEKKPHLRGKDMEITRKACEKFSKIPVSIMNFVEGTRFTPEKHDRQGSEYNYLLKPKAGGVSFVLSALGDKLNYILDITIVYGNKDRRFWHLLCGKITDITVDIGKIPIEKNMIGDYDNDHEYRNSFQAWLNDIWKKKDQKIDRLSYAKN